MRSDARDGGVAATSMLLTPMHHIAKDFVPHLESANLKPSTAERRWNPPPTANVRMA
jgi:hypothetical protein